jgi:adenosylcobyric acid synthase
VLKPVRGDLLGGAFEGYEMHVGRTVGPALARPLLNPAEGAVSADGRVGGCYVHGLFSAASARAALLAACGATAHVGNYSDVVDAALDEIAATLARSLDVAALGAAASIDIP